ncbi:TraR/DksA C4-type zinc finger protein [Paracoccus endophyticus]|uniref:TraR/DksA family transcriptional regulator n=1 Tax=Paracoccus endophyticus TaxID=2233774 RepID=UPI0030B826F3
MLTALGQSDRAEIRRIDAALARIAAGDYGDCVQCGNPIPDKRLQLLPDTPFCANCSP